MSPREQRTAADGTVFDSKAELARWEQLQLMQRAGRISNLARQHPVKLEVNGVLIARMRVDFVYTRCGWTVHEDVKGFVTPDWKLKARLFRAIYGREIEIVKA